MGDNVVHLNQWLTKSQLASTLQVSERWIEIQVKEKGMPSLKLGRSRRFRLDDVERWAERKAS